MGADSSAARVYPDTELTPISSVGPPPVISSPEMIVPRVTSIHLGMDESVRDTLGIPRIRLPREISPWSHFVPKMASSRFPQCHLVSETTLRGCVQYGRDPTRVTYPAFQSAFSVEGHREGESSLDQASEYTEVLRVTRAVSAGIVHLAGRLTPSHSPLIMGSSRDLTIKL